jgi:hypothetical protein
VPINSRAKGKRAELEVCRLLSEGLGRRIHRNWQAQSAEGGHDISGLDFCSIESKHVKQWALPAWWAQTTGQARDAGRVPVLFYKMPLQGWYVVVPWGWLNPEFNSEPYPELANTVIIRVDQFVRVILARGLT